MTGMVKGIPASEGIAAAKAYLLVESDLSFAPVTNADPTVELARLDLAIKKTAADLAHIKIVALKTVGEKLAAVIDYQETSLFDPALADKVTKEIKEQQVNAETAVTHYFEEYRKALTSLADAYMQERAADMYDLQKRLTAHLLGVTLPNLSLIEEEVIIVAQDLTPTDTAQLNKKYVKGFITDLGGKTSHSAIMARTLEIPAIVGASKATTTIQPGDMLLLDGIAGEALINPTEDEVMAYAAKAQDYAMKKAEWELLKDEKSLTKDGTQVLLAANIGTPKDVTGVLKHGAEAIGLFRSEFLYMDATAWPTEEEQFQAYRKVLQAMGDKQVVVRTMDIGGDKELEYADLPVEQNPFLGFRAIRLSLEQQAIFRTQLRALLRASAFGNLAVMFPMIATVVEFKAAKAIFLEEKANLKAAGIPVSDQIEVGMMMEIPAAAMMADKLAKYADFFSIGTNDLIQYTMAADRGNEQVSYLYQPYNPAILRLIKFIIDSAHQAGKWVGMCGEMAGDQLAIPLLLGLGLDEFSMSSTAILPARSLLRKLDTKQMQQLAAQALSDCDTAEEVLALVKTTLE